MANDDQKIHIIMTGGTIDSHWDGKKDTVIPNRHSIIPEFIRGLKLYQGFEFTEIAMKDSRDLTAEDRTKILKTVEKSKSKKVIITHGTYTMTQTARFLKQNLKRKDQTIVLSGSFSPLQGFTISDAPFSVGYALAKVEELPPGVYVCMNGRSFTAEEAAKDIKKGKFYSMFENVK